jgi:hypothetical protein
VGGRLPVGDSDGSLGGLQQAAFPGTLANARYVYVTSYDGDQFDFNILPEDRQAIADVHDAVQQWGYYIVVYRPQDADMILAVQKRGSEDTLAVYDARRGPDSTYLWRAMGRGGLAKNELPLFTQLREAVEKAGRK